MYIYPRLKDYLLCAVGPVILFPAVFLRWAIDPTTSNTPKLDIVSWALVFVCAIVLGSIIQTFLFAIDISDGKAYICGHKKLIAHFRRYSFDGDVTDIKTAQVARIYYWYVIPRVIFTMNDGSVYYVPLPVITIIMPGYLRNVRESLKAAGMNVL